MNPTWLSSDHFQLLFLFFNSIFFGFLLEVWAMDCAMDLSPWPVCSFVSWLSIFGNEIDVSCLLSHVLYVMCDCDCVSFSSCCFWPWPGQLANWQTRCLSSPSPYRQPSSPPSSLLPLLSVALCLPFEWLPVFAHCLLNDFCMLAFFLWTLFYYFCYYFSWFYRQFSAVFCLVCVLFWVNRAEFRAVYWTVTETAFNSNSNSNSSSNSSSSSSSNSSFSSNSNFQPQLQLPVAPAFVPLAFQLFFGCLSQVYLFIYFFLLVLNHYAIAECGGSL